MTKLWAIGAVLLVAGAVMATEHNPLLAEKPVEPTWADYDAATLRVVASRMWNRIQELEADNAALREQLDTERNSNARLRAGMRDMQRPIAPVAAAGSAGSTRGSALPPNVKRDSFGNVDARGAAGSVRMGMTLDEVRATLGVQGSKISETDNGVERWEFVLYRSSTSRQDGRGGVLSSSSYTDALEVIFRDGKSAGTFRRN